MNDFDCVKVFIVIVGIVIGSTIAFWKLNKDISNE